jgi:hypothetical protein
MKIGYDREAFVTRPGVLDLRHFTVLTTARNRQDGRSQPPGI